ncbi:MAG: DPP IV N-terminal domain-containing protein, partial [Acidobacteriota bacterium]
MPKQVPKALVVLALASLVPTLVVAQTKKLTLEAIFDQGLSATDVSEITWMPDGRLAYFKEAEEAADGETDGEADSEADSESGPDLWAVDLTTGASEILVSATELDEMAPTPDDIDEREKTRRSRFEVSAYHFSPDGSQILFTSSGQVVLYHLADKAATVLAPSKKNVLDPKFSPDGQTIAFVADHDIWAVPVSGGAPRQLTTGGHELLLHGDLDWVYPEEFGVRTGYHFSPDSRHIAFLEMDQSSVSTHPITEELAWQATVDLQRYPQPGTPNPRVRVGIVNLETARTVWLDRAAEYIPRIDWADSSHVAVQLLDRRQEALELVLADPASGRSRSVFFEKDPYWVDVTD